eukprot:COSAG06_NODE_16776_length_981_cov_1.717687_1_plen_21_part_10
MALIPPCGDTTYIHLPTQQKL